MSLAIVRLFILTIVCAFCLSACSLGKVYKLDIQQGNIVTQEMIDQLKYGMTKRQVRYVMGTPMLVDTFNQERWDYIYTYQDSAGDYGQENLSLFYRDGLLERIDGNILPSKAFSNDAMMNSE